VAHPVRLIWAVLLWLVTLGFWSGDVLAYGVVPNGGTSQVTYFFLPANALNEGPTRGSTYQEGPDRLAVCVAAVASLGALPNTSTRNANVSADGGSCGGEIITAENAVWRTLTRAGFQTKLVTQPGACPTDATLIGGVCVCNSGFKAEGGVCVPLNCQAVREGLRGQELSWTGNTATFCYGGCNMTASFRGYLAGTNKSSTNGDYVTTDSSSCQGAAAGNNSNGNDPGAGPSPGPAPCPPPNCPGTVNGAAVCVPCTGTTSNGPATGASAPAGSTPPPIPGAPNGATGSKESTTCENGKCTTTTDYTKPDGSTAGTKKEEQSEQDYCRKNPTAPACKDKTESSIGGTCAAVSCKGDAIQCAIAREQARRACEFFEPTGATVDAGLAAGEGGVRPSGHPGATQSPIAFATLIDQADRLPGACPADFSVDIAGNALLVPMSGLCSPLQTLGLVVVGVSMLAAVFIVFRG